MKPEQGMGLEEAILIHVKKLEGFGSRYYAHEGNRGAQEYIESRLRDYGYRVERSIAAYQDASYASPWALKAGRTGPEGKLYLLTAHFDSISQNENGDILEAAPGADDNATGVAVLLEVAKALSGLDLEQSVGFVFFNVEEVGQHASKRFAKEFKGKTTHLDGVINIDTIGTWPLSLGQGGKVNYVTNEVSRPFMERLEASLPLPLKEAETPWEDDHASFWAEGYQAVELTEEGCTPVMHTPQDTSEKIDFESVAAVAQALIALFSKPF
jgi:Zn-dependent M28 family amino/carboxypeptidase